MAQPPYDLCTRHGSQIGINNMEEEVSEEDPNQPQPTPQPLQQKHTPVKEVIEIPVIKMEDFQQVNMNEKLDLLMSAINKINTNFHYKLQISRA